MLQPKKKISKREIKQDTLVTRAMQFEAWSLENRRTLMYGAIAFVAAVVLGVIWHNKSVENELQASTRLAAIIPVIDLGNYQQAIDGVPTEGKAGLRSIVEDYGSTDAGEMAKLYYGNALESLSRWDEALSAYSDVSVSDRLVMSSADAGKASCLEALGRHAEAAKAYERAASVDPKNPLAPERLVRAAVNYGLAGQKDDARNALTTVRREYPTSTAVRDLDRYEAQYAS